MLHLSFSRRLGAAFLAFSCVGAVIPGVSRAELSLDEVFVQGPNPASIDTVYYSIPNQNRFTALAGDTLPFNLFTAPYDGSAAPVQINPALGTDAGIYRFLQFSDDGAMLAYSADADSDSATNFNVFAGPSDGSAAPLRMHTLPSGATGSQIFRLNDDGSWIAMAGRFDASSTNRVYTSNTSIADNAIDLSGTLVANGNASSPLFIPGTDTVVFRADKFTDNVIEMFSAPADGSVAPTRLLTPSFTPGEAVSSHGITADGSRVVFVAVYQTPGVSHLYSVPASGGTPTRLSQLTDPAADVNQAFRLTPDSQRAVYRANDPNPANQSIFSVPLDGSSAPVDLGPTFNIAVGAVAPDFAVSPDSTTVVYLADPDTDAFTELFAAPLDGSAAPLKLNDLSFDADRVFDFAITPDSKRVVYRTASTVDPPGRLASVPITGGTPLLLSDIPDVDIPLEYEISPRNAWVAFTVRDANTSLVSLYLSPADAGEAPRLAHPPLPAYAGLFSPEWSSDGRFVSYISDFKSDNVFSIYSATILPELTSVTAVDTDGPASAEPGFTNDTIIDIQPLGIADADEIEIAQDPSFTTPTLLAVGPSTFSYDLGDPTEGVRTIYARTLNSDFASESVVVSTTIELDLTAPLADSPSPAPAPAQSIPSTSLPVTFTVGFSEPLLEDLQSADLDLSASTTGGVLNASVSLVSASPTPQYEISIDGTGVGSGDIVLGFQPSAVFDRAGNPLEVAGLTASIPLTLPTSVAPWMLLHE